MLKVKGEAFVKKLKEQDIKVHTVSSATLVDFIASGEIGGFVSYLSQPRNGFDGERFGGGLGPDGTCFYQ